MFISDYHVHTNFSGDSSSKPEEMLLKAIELSLTKLCITDHLDYDFPACPISFEFNIDTYFETLLKLKEQYKSKINLLIGVELGLQPQLADKLSKILKTYPFDFVIGSSHLADRLDPYTEDFFKYRTTEEANYRYFESIYENIISFQDFQVYGHLDYVFRYGPNKNQNILYSNYYDIIDKILLKLIELGKGIEINSSGIKYRNEPHPNVQFIKRYYELGGEILTIGSDAHHPDFLCYNFKKIQCLLEEIGLKYYTIFENRKPQQIKI